MRVIRKVAVMGTADPGGMPGSVVRGFQGLGLDATLVPYADWSPKLPGRFRGVGTLNRGLAELASPILAGRALAELHRLRPDLVVIMKCDDLPPLFEDALRRLTRAAIVTFHPDDPWNVGRGLRSGPSHRRAVAHLQRSDLALLWSRGLVARAEAAGARARWLPFACDPTLHPPGVVAGVVGQTSGGEALGAPIIFVGNWDEERERMLAPLAESGLGLAVWGTSYWRDRCRNPALRAAWRGRPLLAAEQGLALRSSALCLNILRQQNKNATNMRTFEVPCMGGFALHEASEEAEELFPPEVAAAYFRDAPDLVAAARRWLSAPSDARARIASEGQRRALAWTYEAWSAAVIEAISG